MSDAHVEVAGPEEVPKPTPLFEAAVVTSLAVAILCLLLFGWLGREILEGDTRHFDDAVRAWAHQFASPGMTRAMTFISLLGYNVLIFEMAIAFIVFAKLRWKRAALWLAITMVGSLLLDLALKYAYRRTRPKAYFGVAPGSYSFPSGHALCSLCFYGVMAGLLSDRIKSLPLRIALWTVAGLLIIAIGLSRIYLGVHYPSDVLGGYLAATVWVGMIIVFDHVRKVRRGSKRTNLFASTLPIVLIACCLGSGSASAQSSKPVANHVSPVRVVSIRFAIGPGLCSICYCGSEIEVRPGSVTLFKRPFRDCQQQNPQRFRDVRVDADLSKKHWQELQQLVKHDALFALPDTIGCPGCADGLAQMIEVKFSDHTTKSVSYETAPAEISLLSEKLSALTAKLEKELPPLPQR